MPVPVNFLQRWPRMAFLADSPRAAALVGTLLTTIILALGVATVGYAELGRRIFLVTSTALEWGPGQLGDEDLQWGMRAVLLASAELVHVLIQIFLLTLPGWFILARWPRLRPDGDPRYDALLAMPITAVLMGSALVLLQNLDAANITFTVVVFAAYGFIAVVLAGDARRREEFVAFVTTNRLFFLLQILVPLCALFYASVGVEGSAQIDAGRLAQRNLHGLPNDNNLSWYASLTWRRHVPANALFGGLWRISDRSPLFGVLDSFLYRALEPATEHYPHYLRLGFVLNSAFVSALFILLRQWASRQRVAWACAALVALNPWFFLNIYYTWPKAFSAYFLVGAIILLWGGSKPTPPRYLWAGLLCGLSGLAHQGSLLSVPFLYLVTIAVHVRSVTKLRLKPPSHGLAGPEGEPSLRCFIRNDTGFRRCLVGLRSSLLLPAVFVLTQVPWIVYKQLYSPDSYNLFIMHYLGERGYFEPLSRLIPQFFAAHPLDEQLAVRGRQFLDLWWGQIQWDSIEKFWSGSWSDELLLRGLYQPEFFYPLHSAGVLWFPWILVGVAINLAFVAVGRADNVWSTVRKPLQPFLTDPTATYRMAPVGIALAFVFVSLSLNTVARWRPPHTHELPYVETVLLATVALYLLRYLGLAYWIMAVLAIGTRQIQYFTLSARTTPLHLPAFDVYGLLFWATCAVLVVLSFRIADHPTEVPDPVPQPHPESAFANLPPVSPARGGHRLLPWLLGLVSLAPFLAFHREFADLFWFGDDWDLLDQIARHGFWSWTLQVFAENFEPVFKLAWGGMVFAANGSYQAMIAALWLTHAVAVVLFATLLRHVGCSPFVIILSAGVFGLTAINLETLGWATQWSAVLAATFFLGAALWFIRTDAVAAPWSWRVHGVLAALIAASAFSFSRGVLTGVALASLCLAAGTRRRVRWSRSLTAAALCIAPAAVAAAVIVIFSLGNHRQLGTAGHVLEMIQFGAWYFALNPFHRLFDVDSRGWLTALVLGAIEVALIGWGLRHSRGRLRQLLALLLVVELGNAALLGIGRYHTGLLSTTSSRYQYAALLGALPFAALWLEHLLQRVAGRPPMRVTAAALLLLIAGWVALHNWAEEVHQWADHRGRYTRRLLFQDPDPPAEGAIPGIPYLSTQRAKELVAHYGLH